MSEQNEYPANKRTQTPVEIDGKQDHIEKLTEYEGIDGSTLFRGRELAAYIQQVMEESSRLGRPLNTDELFELTRTINRSIWSASAINANEDRAEMKLTQSFLAHLTGETVNGTSRISPLQPGESHFNTSHRDYKRSR